MVYYVFDMSEGTRVFSRVGSGTAGGHKLQLVVDRRSAMAPTRIASGGWHVVSHCSRMNDLFSGMVIERRMKFFLT